MVSSEKNPDEHGQKQRMIGNELMRLYEILDITYFVCT